MSIATLVEADAQGLGLGQARFEHTKSQAIVVGLDFIDATPGPIIFQGFTITPDLDLWITAACPISRWLTAAKLTAFKSALIFSLARAALG